MESRTPEQLTSRKSSGNLQSPGVAGNFWSSLSTSPLSLKPCVHVEGGQGVSVLTVLLVLTRSSGKLSLHPEYLFLRSGLLCVRWASLWER